MPELARQRRLFLESETTVSMKWVVLFAHPIRPASLPSRFGTFRSYLMASTAMDN
jgi:hypothetical protein